jgi:DNA-binding Lrp family transcriptional regulator
MPVKFTNIAERNAAMKALRETGKLSDRVIGKIVGLSPTQVANILGKSNSKQHKRQAQAGIEQEILSRLQAGMNRDQVAQELNTTLWHVTRVARKAGLGKAETRLRLSRERVKGELQKYIESGWPLTYTYLVRWDARHGTNLYEQARRFQSMHEWREELGVGNTILWRRLRLAPEGSQDEHRQNGKEGGDPQD